MTRKTPFGKRMRKDHFQFSSSYTPLNHGSFGTYPRAVREAQESYQSLCQARPDTFIVNDLPKLIDESRKAIAPLLGVPMDEVVFVPNATTGLNTVLRNLKFENGDVVLHFSTIYPACKKTIASIGENSPVVGVSIPLQYPMEDEEIVQRFMGKIISLRAEGKNVRIAIFDTVTTFPGARVPWEDLVRACKALGVLSLIDGAHGIGNIDLSHVGKVGPDFFVSNCHKWLYTPRPCAVFHVPTRNQHLIRTSIPTSHGYSYPSALPETGDKTPFVHLFEFVATMDYTPYLCVPAALQFRQEICGGEEKIRNYCWDLSSEGGERVAEILQTEVMDNLTQTLSKCSFSNVRLPLAFKQGDETGQKGWDVKDAPNIQKWLNRTAVEEFGTYLQIDFVAPHMWVRLSGQIYLELSDFEWVGHKLQNLCERLFNGENFN